MSSTSGVVITATAGVALTQLTTSSHKANQFGIILRADPAATDNLLVAFTNTGGTVTFPLKPGEVLRIGPEDAANTGGIWVQRGGGSDITVYALVSAGVAGA